jgi:hypothetical protein
MGLAFLHPMGMGGERAFTDGSLGIGVPIHFPDLNRKADSFPWKTFAQNRGDASSDLLPEFDGPPRKDGDFAVDETRRDAVPHRPLAMSRGICLDCSGIDGIEPGQTTRKLRQQWLDAAILGEDIGGVGEAEMRHDLV